MSGLQGRELIVGVTGGIAAFKTAALVSQLVQQGAGVTVVMTESAKEFIGSTTFSALTGRAVADKLFASEKYPLGAHVELALQADLMCVAPASANFLGKAAHGLADDLLSTLYLAFSKRALLAPAMNCEMWEKAAVQRNLQQVMADGVEIVQPEEGWLSCRQKGVGRMASPESILARIEQLLGAE